MRFKVGDKVIYIRQDYLLNKTGTVIATFHKEIVEVEFDMQHMIPHRRLYIPNESLELMQPYLNEQKMKKLLGVE